MFNRIKIRGIVEWKLRNIITGKVDAEGRGENLFTKDGKRILIPAYGKADYIWIGNDIRNITAENNNFVIVDEATVINDTVISVTSSGWDRDTLTRVLSKAFLAPVSGPRTTTHVGLKPGFGSSTFSNPNNGRHINALTALKIDPPIVQTTVQQLEITYTIVYVLPKSITGLQRFKQMGDAGALRRLRYLYIDGTRAESLELQNSTLPKYWFVDDGAFLFAFSNDPGDTMYDDGWQQQSASLSVAKMAVVDATVVQNVAGGQGSGAGSHNGAFGMAVFGDSASPGFIPGSLETNVWKQEAFAFWPLAFEEGVVGPDVFPKPAASAQTSVYFFNEVGVDKSGQGTLDIQGPYRPTSISPGAPAHWAYRVMISKSGDVVGESTEGEYMFQRKSWISYPFGPQADIGAVPPAANSGFVDRVQGDGTWGGSGFMLEQRAVERDDADDGTTDPRGAHRLVYDGIDSFWGIAWRNSQGGAGPHTMFRWRANTHENFFMGADNPRLQALSHAGDDAQSDFRFVDQDGDIIGFSNDFPYAFTTDGAGLVFYGHRDTDNTAANNPVFRIDNTQPGRWKQRPSGISDGVDDDRFTIDTADEVHDMFPFVGGDVGRTLRITDGPNAGLYDIAAVSDSNNVDLFDTGTSNPAVLAADTETTWHWCVVTKLINHLVGELFHLAYDQANGRLWAMGALGLQLSTDDGATWSALVSEAGGSLPQFPDADPRTAVQGGHTNDFTQSPLAIDANGDFYWISDSGAEFWLNKLSFVTTGPGGDATFSRLGLTADFPGSNKPSGINQLVFNIGTDNGNGLGAIWIYADPAIATTTESFFRLVVNTGALNSGDLTEYDPASLKFDRHPHWIMSTPGGKSVLSKNNQNPNFFHDTRLQGTGTGLDKEFTEMNATTSAIFSNDGADRGYKQSAFRPDGTFLTTAGDEGYGVFGSFWDNYFWDGTNWLPWEGTGAEFDTYHGVSTGGKKVPHESFEELLDNVQVKFTSAGGGTNDIDEFKEGESFGFIASFGPHRTNVEDFSLNMKATRMGGEYKIESEPVKLASPNTRPARVFWPAGANPGLFAAGAFVDVSGATPLTGVKGKLWGWEPNEKAWMAGQGDSPETITVGNQSPSWQATVDLGSTPPEIGKLLIMVSNTSSSKHLAYISAESGADCVIFFGASDNGTFIDNVFGDDNEFDIPNARWDSPNLQFPVGFNIRGGVETDVEVGTYRGYVIEIDLVALGMDAGERTHQYWQIGMRRGPTGGSDQARFYSMQAVSPAGALIGFDGNHRVDEATVDPDFSGVFIDEMHWIQDTQDDAPNNPTTVSTAGTSSGFTDFVTVDAGTFNTGEIDIATDYLSWEESENVGPGFLRNGANTPGAQIVRGKFGVVNDIDDRPSGQAMSKITAVTTTTITVRDSIIPDDLSGADWEVRRPVFDGTDYSGRPIQSIVNVDQDTNPNAIGYDPQTGYFNQQEANETALRRFRVTRKGVFRLV